MDFVCAFRLVGDHFISSLWFDVLYVEIVWYFLLYSGFVVLIRHHRLCFFPIGFSTLNLVLLLFCVVLVLVFSIRCHLIFAPTD